MVSLVKSYFKYNNISLREADEIAQCIVDNWKCDTLIEDIKEHSPRFKRFNLGKVRNVLIALILYTNFKSVSDLKERKLSLFF